MKGCSYTLSNHQSNLSTTGCCSCHCSCHCLSTSYSSPYKSHTVSHYYSRHYFSSASHQHAPLVPPNSYHSPFTITFPPIHPITFQPPYPSPHTPLQQSTTHHPINLPVPPTTSTFEPTAPGPLSNKLQKTTTSRLKDSRSSPSFLPSVFSEWFA